MFVFDTRSPFCTERQRLSFELDMLLGTKAALRIQIVELNIPKPAERRAALAQVKRQIDDVIALIAEHHQHCYCEKLKATS